MVLTYYQAWYLPVYTRIVNTISSLLICSLALAVGRLSQELHIPPVPYEDSAPHQDCPSPLPAPLSTLSTPSYRHAFRPPPPRGPAQPNPALNLHHGSCVVPEAPGYRQPSALSLQMGPVGQCQAAAGVVKQVRVPRRPLGAARSPAGPAPGYELLRSPSTGNVTEHWCTMLLTLELRAHALTG